MYGFTKSIAFTLFSTIFIGALALNSIQTNDRPPSDDGFNDYPVDASEYLLQREIDADPNVKALLNAQETPYYDFVNSGALSPEADYTLPVVVHVIHQNGAENIDNAQVQTAIDHLNDAFENVGYYDQNTGVNTQIEFCLAKTNPMGEPSTGVTRVEDPLTNVTIETEDLALKDLDRWDPNTYINIWVVSSIGSNALVNTIRSYAYMPVFHGTNRDGLVVEAEFMGSSEENSTALVRAMGHYLGLYSTFHAGCGNDDCLMDGDRVCDTPPDWTIAEAPCEVEENSCFTDVNPSDANNPFTIDTLDMRENYMDINPLACYSAFTQGQTDRMTFFITGARSSLNGTTVCSNDCDSPIEDLAISVPTGSDTTLVINSGQLLLQSTSTNATTFEWFENGVSVGTGANFVYNPDSAGLFTITLTASNDDADCTLSRSITISVIDCFGNTHVDDATGVDVFMCGQPGSPCKTIQFALDNSICSGDTIFIHSGTYSLPAATPTTTPIALIPQDSTFTFFGVEDNGPVIIDGDGVRRGFVYDYSGGTCPTSQADNGINAFHGFNFTHLTIQNTFSGEEQCSATEYLASGSAIHVVNTNNSILGLNLDDCRFISNVSMDDELMNIDFPAFGAVYFDGKSNDNSGIGTASSVSVKDCEFSQNRADHIGNGGLGGALSIFDAAIINISDSYFCDNAALGNLADAGDLSFNRNGGGAIAISSNSNLVAPSNYNYSITNCYFFNNSATTAGGAGFPDQSEGGAIFLAGDFSDNTATSTSVLNISNSSFFNNNIETGIEHFDNSVGSIVETNNTLQDAAYMLSLGNDTTICNIDSITIGTTALGAEYIWNTGATTSSITVSDTGMYVLTISMGVCEFVDSIHISEIICGEICGNGIDDDGDGLIDCFDPECCGQLACDLAFYNDCPDACTFSSTMENFGATLKWQSSFETSIANTPITADIDGDGTPEIIIAAESLIAGELLIINGQSGNVESTITLPVQLGANGMLAVADVDKDGTAEIFNYRGTTITRYEHDGTETASFTLPGSGIGFSSRVGIADFNSDGDAEVYANNTIFNASDLTVLATLPVTTGDAQYSVAADVLDDTACPNCEGLEIVMGNKVYSVNVTTGAAAVITEADMSLDNGIVSIADVDKDGDLDGVVSGYTPANPTGSPTIIYGWDLQTGAILGQFNPGDNASPATIADIEGDGQLEIVFRTETNMVALENDFTMKWMTPSLEDGINLSGPISFDFDGDGSFEIIARGTEAFEIFNGADGTILFSDPLFSGTRAETPVVVDVDGDGVTEVVVAGANNQNGVTNDAGFLRVYTSNTFPWQTTRELWNQSAFFNVNIHDDLSVPLVQQQHHIVGDDVVLNNFLAIHGEQLGSDAIITSVDVLCSLDELIVTMEICNNGQNELSFSTPITFYRDNPTAVATTALATESLGVILQPDSCTFVEYTIPAQYDDPIFAVVNDDNSTNTPYDLNMDFPNTNIGECNYANNVFQFVEMPEPFELDLGGAITICDNSSIELNASSHFVSYEWQDGTTDSTFTAYDGGMYTVTVIDSCGGTQVDSVQLIVDPNTVNMTMPENAIVCPTQDTSFTVMGDFDTFVWLPDDFLDCDTCQTVNVIDPDMEMQYIVTASNSQNGCYSVDTVTLTFTSIATADAIQTCPGESVMIHGNMESMPGQYSETFTSVLGCDSTSTVTLSNLPQIVLSFQESPTCPGGSFGTATVSVSGGVAANYDWSVAGAGNSPTINNVPAGTYTVTVTDGNDCMTEGSVTVTEIDDLQIDTDFISPTCPGDTDGVLEILNPDPNWMFSLNGGAFQSNSVFTGLAGGVYDITVQDGDCIYSNNIGIVNDPPGTTITGQVFDGTTYPDSASILVSINSPNTIDNISWSPTTGMSCTNCLNPSVLPLTETSEYTITVTDSEGCVASQTFVINITIPCNPADVPIPNAFTPDGDGVNDTFGAVVLEGIEEVTNMRIYNRWGNVVFETETGEEWDGTDGSKSAPSDVYVYVMTIRCTIGEEKAEIRSGDVTLIR